MVQRRMRRHLRPVHLLGILYAVVLGVSFVLFQQDPPTPLSLRAGLVMIALIGLLIPGAFFYQSRQNWLADQKQWSFVLFLLGIFWAVGILVKVMNFALRLTP